MIYFVNKEKLRVRFGCWNVNCWGFVLFYRVVNFCLIIVYFKIMYIIIDFKGVDSFKFVLYCIFDVF